MTRILIIAIVAYLQMANSQYYSQPSTYQPYNCFQSAAPPALPPAMYAPPFPSNPSMYAPQPNLPSPYSIAPYAPTISSQGPYPPTIASQGPYPPTIASQGPYSPTIASQVPYPPTFASQGPYPPIIASQGPYPPTFAPMPSITPPAYPPAPMYATPAAYSPAPAIPPLPYSYPAHMASSKPPPGSKTTQIGLPTSKYAPATATAYYLTAQETPKVALAEKVKENLKELAPPTYPCPFCTGFANVPKNSKVPPPPPCSAVLPGILDKIPTIALPDELKLKDLCKFAKPCPLLSDLFEHKLSGKLKFDEDLLDGFLTGLGLGK